ncbi:MAG TPA: tetratricopeptide repeat-containing protein [Thermoanaerobaculia bacterium]|nr:tetratricopeptide repeat-containing protein [Thermoanaerobaculia bacterium]
MIMPYGERKTGVAAKSGPTKVDFDALWNEVYLPVIKKLRYQPVRADQDLGAVIIKDMIERLTIADLVLADITIANANVYYEIGVRHAAAATGCVLLSANWAKPAFDLAQIRHEQFPLKSTRPSRTEAKALQNKLVAAIKPHIDARSPIFDLLPGYPPARMKDATSFADLVGEIARFQGEVKAAVSASDESDRKNNIRALAKKFLLSKPIVHSLALELLPVIRDNADFEDVLAYIKALPKSLRESPYVQEQRSLAASKTDDHKTAIAGLEALIALKGETSERRALLGGRYKKLYLKNGAAADLDAAIDNYRRGMALDLNDYYSPSNLPRLLRTRGRQGDEKLAVTAAEVTRAACARQQAIDPDDEWLGQTMLGQAVDAQDLVVTRKLVEDVLSKRQTRWKLDVTTRDIEMSVNLIRDKALRKQFEEALAPLKKEKKEK